MYKVFTASILDLPKILPMVRELHKKRLCYIPPRLRSSFGIIGAIMSWCVNINLAWSDEDTLDCIVYTEHLRTGFYMLSIICDSGNVQKNLTNQLIGETLLTLPEGAPIYAAIFSKEEEKEECLKNFGFVYGYTHMSIKYYLYTREGVTN